MFLLRFLDKLSFEILFRDQQFIRYSSSLKNSIKNLENTTTQDEKIHVFVTFSATMAAAIGDYWSAGMKERRHRRRGGRGGQSGILLGEEP